MVSPQSQPEHASIPSQNAVARTSAVQAASMPSSDKDTASKITSTSNKDIRADNINASDAQLIARAIGEPAIEFTESLNGNSASLQNYAQEKKTSPVMNDELAKAVKKMPNFSDDQKKPMRPYHETYGWQVPKSKWAAMDDYCTSKFGHSDIIPGQNTSAPFHIQVGSFNQRWALWASEIKDEKVRKHVINVAMEKMEAVWRYGIDQGCFPKHLQQENGAGKKSAKRDKNDEFLNFEDDIETHIEEKSFGRSTKGLYKVTGKELKATGVSLEKLNTRIATRDVSAGEKIFFDFVQSLEGGKIGIGHWKARTDITGVNIHGRDLFIYALHEVQTAKQEIRTLQGYLPSHKTACQKRNTITRIAHRSALINTWLAIAIELNKLRLKNETDVNENSEVEIVQEAAPTPGSSRQEFISPAEKFRKDDYLTLKSSTTSQEHTSSPEEDFLSNNPKFNVPFDDLADISVRQEQLKMPLTPKTPGPGRLIVKLRVPTEQPDGGEILQTQTTASKQDRQGARNLQKKRKVVHDSDDEFEDKERMDTKRKKTNDSRKQVACKDVDKQFPTTPQKQIFGLLTPTRSPSASVPAHSIRALSDEEKERRNIYLRNHFLPIVNKILKFHGINHMRSIPKDWTVVKSKLESARVPPKQRNSFLKQFKFGFQAQPPGHQPSQGGSSAIKEQDNDAMLPPSTSGEQGLIVTLRVPSGFNPASYSANTTMILPGYRYRFTPQSSLNDRTTFSTIIAQSVKAVLAGEPPNGEWTRVFGQYKPVISSVGVVIADGFWDELDGTPAAKGAWLFGDGEGKREE